MSQHQPTWRERYEQLVELLGIAAPVLDEIQRDGVTDDNRLALQALQLLVCAEVATA